MQFAKRSILHLDLDSFFVSVERLKDPSLLGKPVIVGAVGNRGVVSSCSYEARKLGVHSAMSTIKARQLCPHGVYLPGDSAAYSQYSRLVTQIIMDTSPLYEKASIDEFYIDLTGMDKYFGAYKWSQELRQKIIKETRLPISFGLGSNKMIAKMATNAAKPNGELHIQHGQEQAFLDPLAVSKIPMVGEKLTESLHRLNIFTIKQLREISIENLINLYGKTGIMLWNKARGISLSLVSNYHEEKSISVERTFDVDTDDRAFLEAALFVLTEKLSYDLRKLKRMTGCVTVKVRYSDFSTVSKQHTIDYSLSTRFLIESATTLFHSLFDSSKTVRLIGVRFSHLIHHRHQALLFDDRTNENNLYRAIDQVKNKYGSKKLLLARGIDLSSVRHNRDVLAEMKKDVNRENSIRK